MTSLRVLLIGGAIAYRATFNWIRPSIYIPTMLGGPLFQILFWVELGRYSGAASDSFLIVGNAIQCCAMAGIYGSCMTIGNERYYETLSSLLATPANRAALFLGRALPQIANGLLVSAFGFAVGVVLLGFRMPAGNVPALVLVVVVTTVSCTAFGMLFGSIGLRARDIFLIGNIVYFSMLILCGVNVPLHVLPGWMQVISQAFPLTHGIEAARRLASGGSLGGVAGLVLAEASIGAAYAVLALGVFRLFEVEARRRGTVESM